MEEDQLLKGTIQDRDNWRKQSLEQGKEVSKLKKQLGTIVRTNGKADGEGRKCQEVGHRF